MEKKMSGAWWILPLFFGLMGGIISAIVAGSRGVSWIPYVGAGFIMSFLWLLLYFVACAALFSM